MNKERRKEINDAIKQLESIKDSIYDILYGVIDEVKCDEECAYDNLPEQFQDGVRGYQMQENIENLEYAQDVDYESAIDEIIDYLENAKGE